MVTLFQVMSGDQWRLVLASTIEPAFEAGDGWGVTLAGLFTCSFFFYGQTVLANRELLPSDRLGSTQSMH